MLPAAPAVNIATAAMQPADILVFVLALTKTQQRKATAKSRIEGQEILAP